jgi:hypothetical protein
MLESAREMTDFPYLKTHLAHEKRATTTEDGQPKSSLEKVRACKISFFAVIAMFSAIGEACARLIVFWAGVGGL